MSLQAAPDYQGQSDDVDQPIMPLDGSTTISEGDINNLSVCIGIPVTEEDCWRLQIAFRDLNSQYERMEKEIKKVLTDHIPIVLRKLNDEKLYMDRWHKVTNAVTIGGAAAGVAGVFIPVVGGGVAIAGSIVVIAALLFDLWGQRQTKKVTKALQEEFERNCLPAREAYVAVLQSFDKFCTEYVKCISDRPKLLEPQSIEAHTYTSTNDSLQQIKLPALQAASCGTALGDLATSITSIAIDFEENATKFVTILQNVIPVASKVASTATILGGICSGYVLVETLVNFFKPCKQSQHTEAYMQKIRNFETELKHLLDKSDLGIMLMKSETERVCTERRIKQLENENENLLEECKEMALQHRTEIEYHTEQYQETLEALSKQHKQSLDLEQQKHAERLEDERQLYMKKLAYEKQQYEESIKLAQQNHTEQLYAEKKQHEECLMLEKQQHLEELKAQRLLLKEEKQQHKDQLKAERDQFTDILKQEQEQSKKTITVYQNMLDAFLKQTQK